MQEVSKLIEQIPIRHDLVSSFILAGVLIGLWIVLVVFIRSDAKNHTTRIFGFLLLVELLLVLDGYLCYTGLIKYSLHLNDLTEPLSLLLGPLIYLFIRAIVHKENFKLEWDVLHLLPAIIYFLTQAIYYAQPLALKYNAYTQAYHPSLEYIDYSYSSIFLFSDWVKDYFRWFIIVSIGVYLLLSIRIYYYQIKQATNNVKLKEKRHLFSVNLLVLAAIVFLLILIIFTNFQNDLGDHYIYIFLTVINFVAAGFIMAESRFFEKSWVSDKYDTSGLKNVSKGLFVKIENYVIGEQYFLNNDTSLRDLAEKLNSSPNYISQAINKEKGINFNEFINRYRIEEAVKRLKDENYKHYNIEGVGESVGFNAKTTFYAAFKKQIGETPASYLKSSKSKS